MNGAIVLTIPKYDIPHPLFLTHSSIRQLKTEVPPSLSDSLKGIWKIRKRGIFTPLSQNNEDFKK